MNKKISLGAAITFMIVVAGITFCITMMISLNYFNGKVLNVNEREQQFIKIAEVDRNARQNYAGTIDEEALNNSLAAGFIRGLGDRYSTYLTKDEYEAKTREDEGEIIQSGLLVEKDLSGYFTVTQVYENSPAATAGFLAGDLIIAADGGDLANTNLLTFENQLKREPGNTLSFVYRRDGVDAEAEIQWKEFDIPYVVYSVLGDNGYIKINAFHKKAPAQFKTALDELVRGGAKGLIFDLRGNNSDSLDAAISMLDTLLPAGELGTKKEGKDAASVSLGKSDGYSIDLPMAVVVDAQTEGVSEYFAATLKSFGKANIIGVTTAGKDVIQEYFQINDGSAIYITVGYFYPPSGDVIGGVGIKPDYEVKLTAGQEEAELTLETDPQMQKAVEVVNSKAEE